MERKSPHSINGRIGAELSWSRTNDRSARTRAAREKFLQRFEREVDPDGKLPPDERRRRAEHAKRAYMLRLAKRAVGARSEKQVSRSSKRLLFLIINSVWYASQILKNYTWKRDHDFLQSLDCLVPKFITGTCCKRAAVI